MQSELIIIYLHFISITIDPKNGFQVKLSFHIIVQMCLVITKSYENTCHAGENRGQKDRENRGREGYGRRERSWLKGGSQGKKGGSRKCKVWKAGVLDRLDPPSPTLMRYRPKGGFASPRDRATPTNPCFHENR